MHQLFLEVRRASPWMDKCGDSSSHTTATLGQHRIGTPATLIYLLSQLQAVCVEVQWIINWIISQGRKIKEKLM